MSQRPAPDQEFPEPPAVPGTHECANAALAFVLARCVFLKAWLADLIAGAVAITDAPQIAEDVEHTMRGIVAGGGVGMLPAPDAPLAMRQLGLMLAAWAGAVEAGIAHPDATEPEAYGTAARMRDLAAVAARERESAARERRP